MNQPEPFQADVHLSCIDPASSKRRFYLLSVQRTIFGEWALVRKSGRTGGDSGPLCDLYPSRGPAIDAPSALTE